jgi:DNA-damage-inducible protein J
MSKSDFVRARVDPMLKADAEAVLVQLGLSTSELITMTLRQVVMQQAVPFVARIPNAETMAAVTEHRAAVHSGTAESFADSKDLFKTLKKSVRD